MDHLDKALGWVETQFLRLAVISMIVITAIICYGVIARSLHGPSFPDDILIVRQLMVVAITTALGYATAARVHIAIDLLYNALPPGLRKACNLLACAIGLLAFAPLTFWAYEEFAGSLANGDYMYGKLKLPEWPGELMFFLGLFVMLLRLLALLAMDVLRPGPVDAHPEEGA